MINTHDWKMIPTVKLEQKKKVSWADKAYLERGLVPEQRLEIEPTPAPVNLNLC